MLKALNYDGEMFIIEEVQLFQHQEPIKILKFSNATVKTISNEDVFFKLMTSSSLYHCHCSVFVGSILYRVSCMQVQSMEQYRFHWPHVGGPYPVWTVY